MSLALESAPATARSQPGAAVTELLAELRASTTHYCRTELPAPWGLAMAACPIPVFHFIATGRCWLSGVGAGRWLTAGDFAVLPRGHGHQLSDRPGRPARAVRRLSHRHLAEHSSLALRGGPGERTVLLSGGSAFDPADPAIVSVLPDVLVVPVGEGWLAPLLLAAARPGPDTGGIVARLTEVLVVHAIRTWLLDDPRVLDGYVGALHDEHLGRALDLMHRHPTRPWTVATLAAETRLSRSQFAQRFASQVGRTPMAYLTDLRIRLATDLIVQQGLTAAEAATRTGYGSVGAFTRAYKRMTGRTPGATRTEPRSV